eukprot:gene3441-13497_t
MAVQGLGFQKAAPSDTKWASNAESTGEGAISGFVKAGTKPPPETAAARSKKDPAWEEKDVAGESVGQAGRANLRCGSLRQGGHATKREKRMQRLREA